MEGGVNEMRRGGKKREWRESFDTSTCFLFFFHFERGF